MAENHQQQDDDSWRKIILFIDNCPAHKLVTLSNLKCQFLPANTTSKLQPCDAGIIQNIQLHFRIQLLKHVLELIEKDLTSTGPQLVGRIDLLDAILWWVNAWKLVSPDTINKCFKKCGFGKFFNVLHYVLSVICHSCHKPLHHMLSMLPFILTCPFSTSIRSGYQIINCFLQYSTGANAEMEVNAGAETPATSADCPEESCSAERPAYESLLPEGVTMEEYCAIDADAQTSTLEEVVPESETEQDVQEEEEEDVAVEQPISSVGEVYASLHKLKRFCVSRGVMGGCDLLSNFEKVISDDCVRKSKQASLDAWLKK